MDPHCLYQTSASICAIVHRSDGFTCSMPVSSAFQSRCVSEETEEGRDEDALRIAGSTVLHGSWVQIVPFWYATNSGEFTVGSSHGVSGRIVMRQSPKQAKQNILPTSIVKKTMPALQMSTGGPS